MTAVEVAAYLTDYAGSFDAPIEAGHDVRELVRDRERLHRAHLRRVVGSAQRRDRHRLVRPAPRARLRGTPRPGVAQITPSAYRNPAQLPDGRVLVVGASATGVQIADELARAGREVVLAVGRHSRVPRRYRGMDIWWWLDQIGTFAKTIDEIATRTAGPQRGRPPARRSR